MPHKNPEDRRAYMAAYRSRNQQRLKVLNASWQAKNTEYIRQYGRDYRARNKEKVASAKRLSAQRNQARVKAYQRAYKTENTERLRLARRHESSKIKHRARAMKFYRAHKPQLQALRRQRYRENPEFRLRILLQSRLIYALRSQNVKKLEGTKELVGCELSFLRNHIESQFLPGMTWENHGNWHIDHMRPCASFLLRDPAQRRACFNWRNLQPLWGIDNLRKGVNVVTH